MNAFEHAVLSDIRSRQTTHTTPKLRGKAKKIAENMTKKGWLTNSDGYRLTDTGQIQLDQYNRKAQQPMKLRGINGAGGMK